jgi:CPA2 family monovalent cation:H+ antiporter-2
MLGLEYSADELVGSLRSGAFAGAFDAVLNALPGAAFALLLGWGWDAALVLAGITWVSSSGVIAKVLGDLGRLGNRETPIILSVLVIEDLAMAFYLPLVTAVLAGVGFFGGLRALAVAVITVIAVLVVAIRYGRTISRFMSVKDPEALLLSVLGLTLFVAGVAAELKVSAAVGAFLVGIALSGPVAHHATQILSPLCDLFAAVFFVFFGLSTDPAAMPPVLLPAFGLAVLTMLTKVATGYLAARRGGIALPGRLRAGLALMPRGEFSVVIAGLAVASGVEPELGPLATAYVLITVVSGPMLARLTDYAWFKTIVRKRMSVGRSTLAVGTSD